MIVKTLKGLNNPYGAPAIKSASANRFLMGSKAMELIFEQINQGENLLMDKTNYINTGFRLVMRKSIGQSGVLEDGLSP